MVMSAELKGCVTWFINFWIFFRWGITVPSFIIVGYVWQISGRGPFCPPSSVSSPEIGLIPLPYSEYPTSMNSPPTRVEFISLKNNYFCWFIKSSSCTLNVSIKLLLKSSKLLFYSCWNTRIAVAYLEEYPPRDRKATRVGALRQVRLPRMRL